MKDDIFPYTEKIPFFKIDNIRHGITQIFPPANWKDYCDYFGFHAVGDNKTHSRYDNMTIDVYLKEDNDRSSTIVCHKGHSFFINYKKSIIYAIPDTFKIEN